MLDKADSTIVKQNQQLRTRHEQLLNMRAILSQSPNSHEARQRTQKAQQAFDTEMQRSLKLEQKHTGSGKEKIWYPGTLA